MLVHGHCSLLEIEVSENDLAAEDKRNEIRSPFYTFTEYTR